MTNSNCFSDGVHSMASPSGSNREVKSSAFTTYFSIPENAAKLYTALDGVEVSPEDIVYTTLSGVLFMARKNDMAFTVRNKVLVISEHQSTVNQNMPLRDVIYYGRTMEKLVEPKDLYKRTRIPIPTPEFYVFYNGNDPFPAEKIMNLSDAYLEKTDNPMLELSVKVININLPTNHAILQKCRPLYEYSWFIEQIKKYLSKGKTRDEAILLAMQDCKQSDIMADFMKEHGSEAINMLFTEFNMDDALEVRYEEGLAAGEAKGMAIGETASTIRTIRKLLAKAMSTEAIADMLELDISYVTTIISLCETYPDEADTRIAEQYLSAQNQNQ